MPLFHVQDSDCPMWVKAETYDKAVNKWKDAMAVENGIEVEEVELPKAVALVAEDDELILD